MSGTILIPWMKWRCPLLPPSSKASTTSPLSPLWILHADWTGLTTVAVKQGIGRFAARMVAPRRARELIEAGARQALADLSAVAPYDPGRPSEIRVEFNITNATEEYTRKPGVEAVDSREVVSRADDWWAAWRQFFF